MDEEVSLANVLSFRYSTNRLRTNHNRWRFLPRRLLFVDSMHACRLLINDTKNVNKDPSIHFYIALCIGDGKRQWMVEMKKCAEFFYKYIYIYNGSTWWLWFNVQTDHTLDAFIHFCT